jgi:heptaprenyl diphosphate synthase
MFASITVILGFLENMFPMPLPGIRLGLANIGIMLAIYALPAKDAFAIALIKAIIIPVLTGNLFMKMILGFPATLISTSVMIIYYNLTKKYSSPVSTGALGGFVHINIQFLIIKLFMVKTLAIYTVLPYFSFLSVISGSITGYMVSIIINRFKKRFKEV